MGQKADLKCPKCSYQVHTSDGPGGGFVVFTNTYDCSYCNSLVDLVTSRTDDKGIKKEDPKEIIRSHQCPKCFGTRFSLWDSIAKLCPRCKTKMTSDFE